MKKLLLIAIVSIFAFTAHASDTTSVSVDVGVFKSSYLGLNDQVTGTNLNATYSNITVSNPTPGIATVAQNGTLSSIKVTGIAPGTGYATVTCTASYVDPGDGLQKTEQKSIVIAYTVVGTPHGAKLSLTFN